MTNAPVEPDMFIINKKMELPVDGICNRIYLYYQDL